MKKFLSNLIVNSCAASLFTAAASASELNIGETYVFSEKPVPYAYAIENYDNKAYRRSRKCWNATRFYIRFTYFGHLIMVTSPEQYSGPRDLKFNRDCSTSDFGPLVEIYDTEYGRNKFQTIGNNLWAQMTPRPEEYLKNVSQEMTLERLSRDGRAVYATFTLLSDAIRSQSPTGRLRVTANLKLNNCIDRFGEIIETDHSEMNDVASALDALRRSAFSQYARCTLEIVGELKPIDRLASRLSFNNKQTFEIFSDLPDEITLLSSGKIRGQFTRQGAPIDPAAEARAQDAANKFRTLVINDYGYLLYRLSENPNLPDDEKNEAIRAFFEANGQKMKSYLDTIDREFPSMSLLSKLTILQSIKHLYSEIGRIEKLAAPTIHISLDRVIERQL